MAEKRLKAPSLLGRLRERMTQGSSDYAKRAAAALERERRQGDEENRYKRKKPRHERLGDIVLELIAGREIGSVLEIGGRANPYRALFPQQVRYMNLDLFHRDEQTIKGDIRNCPEIADERFDLIISIDVFEHIDQPWRAAAEITRLLKPGGLTYHSTLFAWRYHPCPGDYFRYTPEGLKALFPELRPVMAEFDGTERRRNMMGKHKNALVADAFGGWRENWRVHYAGEKALAPGARG